MASGEGEKVISTNRKARHDFEILETYEAGLVLRGTEVKSLREGQVNFKDSYASIDRGEAWLVGCHRALPSRHRRQPRSGPLAEAPAPSPGDRAAAGEGGRARFDHRAPSSILQGGTRQARAGVGARQEDLR